MTSLFASDAIRFPLDRPTKIARFPFASTGGEYLFTLSPLNGGYEMMAEWCEPGETEPSDGGYNFWGGAKWFPTPHEALGAMYEWMARTALEEKLALTDDAKD